MANDPRDLYLRSQEDKEASADPRDLYLQAQEDKGFDPAFIGVSTAVRLYDWTGYAGQLIKGFVLEGLSSVYEYTGNVGSIAIGWSRVQALIENYQWTGFAGTTDIKKVNFDISGSITNQTNQQDIVDGGKVIVITVNNDTWIPL